MPLQKLSLIKDWLTNLQSLLQETILLISPTNPRQKNQSQMKKEFKHMYHGGGHQGEKLETIEYKYQLNNNTDNLTNMFLNV